MSARIYVRVDTTCDICGKAFQTGKRLSIHVISEHGMSCQDYAVRVNYNGVRPTCPECGGTTRYKGGFRFTKYCAACGMSYEVQSKLGHVGGHIKKTWSKGKTKANDPILAKFAEAYCSEGNPFHGRKHKKSTLDGIAAKKRNSKKELERRLAERMKVIGKFVVLSDLSEYHGQTDLLHVRCDTCGTEAHVSFSNIERCWRCRTCNPKASVQQLEVFDYVRSLGFEDAELDAVGLIDGKLELDVWVPSKRLAIEYHGLYWHSGGRDGEYDPMLHRKKRELCMSSGIKLIQLFSDEWRDKRAICESMIRNALGMNEVKLDARDCSVEESTVIFTSPFLIANHIGAAANAKHHIILRHKKYGIVGVMTLRKPLQGKYATSLEIARMAFRCGCTVRGGASKLVSKAREIARREGSKSILSYAELRYGEGKVYETCGFRRMGETESVNYWYTDGEVRYDRTAFRARTGMSEAAVADESGVKAIHGAGNAIYLLTL